MSAGSPPGHEPFRLLEVAVQASAPSREAPFPITVEAEIPAGSPLFTGHFPGHPVLPGICHLALVSQALADLACRGAWDGPSEILEVRKLRLRRLVSPESRLTLNIAPAGRDGRFEIRRGLELASHGEISTVPGEISTGMREAPAASVAGPRAGEEGADAAAVPGSGAAPEDRAFPAASTLLPHLPPALLLTEVQAAAGGAIVATATIPLGHPLTTGTTAPGFLAIEIGAQAAGALYGLAQLRGGSTPRIGYLAGVRLARLPATLPAGERLVVTARTAGGSGGLAVYEIELALARGTGGHHTSSAGPIAVATLSTFLPDSSAGERAAAAP